MAISKRVRFEVLKRNHFTCQYCGRRAPDVVLEVDHMKPRAEGGSDDIWNLTTACLDCNQGKSANLISTEEWLHHQRRIALIIQAVNCGDLPAHYAKSPASVLAWANIFKLLDENVPTSPFYKGDSQDEARGENI